jgi:hypothetical protein
MFAGKAVTAMRPGHVSALAAAMPFAAFAPRVSFAPFAVARFVTVLVLVAVFRGILIVGVILVIFAKGDLMARVELLGDAIPGRVHVAIAVCRRRVYIARTECGGQQKRRRASAHAPRPTLPAGEKEILHRLLLPKNPRCPLHAWRDTSPPAMFRLPAIAANAETIAATDLTPPPGKATARIPVTILQYSISHGEAEIPAPQKIA